MLREINLIEYIPEFMREYAELKELYKTEDIELQKLNELSEVVKNNQFINYCDEVGISKFESLLGIVPEENDLLDNRIARVLSKWNDELPYTLNGLRNKLEAISNGKNFVIVPMYDNYTIELTVSLPLKSQLEELKDYLKLVLPANMDYFINNILQKEVDGVVTNGNVITKLIRRSTVESEAIE